MHHSYFRVDVLSTTFEVLVIFVHTADTPPPKKIKLEGSTPCPNGNTGMVPATSSFANTAAVKVHVRL